MVHRSKSRRDLRRPSFRQIFRSLRVFLHSNKAAAAAAEVDEEDCSQRQSLAQRRLGDRLHQQRPQLQRRLHEDDRHFVHCACGVVYVRAPEQREIAPRLLAMAVVVRVRQLAEHRVADMGGCDCISELHEVALLQQQPQLRPELVRVASLSPQRRAGVRVLSLRLLAAVRVPPVVEVPHRVADMGDCCCIAEPGGVGVADHRLRAASAKEKTN